MSLRKILTGSFLLFTANMGSGVLNYVFQIRAASQLSAPEYGVLNAWMAYLGLILSVAVIVQISSNFHLLGGGQLKRVGAALLTLTILILCLLLVLQRQDLLSPVWIAVLAAVLAIGFHGLLGQFQGSTWFAWMGTSILIASAFKLGFTFFSLDVGSKLGLYYLAFPASFGLACLFESLVSLLVPLKTQRKPRHVSSRDLLGAGILALSMAFIPQLDLLNLRATQSDQILGEFSRASLFSKAIFFAAMTLLQVSLPFHIQAQKGEISVNVRHRIQRLERLGLLACVILSFLLASLSPWLSKKYMGFDLTGKQSWVLLSCLTVTALYGQLQTIQLRCALGQWKQAAVRLFGLAAFIPVVALVHPASVVHYLEGALAFYLVMNASPWILAGVRKKEREPQ